MRAASASPSMSTHTDHQARAGPHASAGGGGGNNNGFYDSRPHEVILREQGYGRPANGGDVMGGGNSPAVVAQALSSK